MTCHEARESMMTADADDLLARGDGALAAHLRTCPACADAGRVLHAALGALAIRVNRRSRRRAALLVGIPAAAAAVVVGVFLAEPGADAPAPRRLPIPANVVSVDVNAGQHTTVLKTSDPKVTVVWISSGESK